MSAVSSSRIKAEATVKQPIRIRCIVIQGTEFLTIYSKLITAQSHFCYVTSVHIGLPYTAKYGVVVALTCGEPATYGAVNTN